MVFNTGYNKNIFILGAGASKDYGLPLWGELSEMIVQEIEKPDSSTYKNKRQIMEWVEMVGKGKKYTTIDACIEKESIAEGYHEDGHEIENELFCAMGNVLKNAYVDNPSGWVRLLNERIRFADPFDLHSSMVFINYNYDDVLDRNLLDYSHVPAKHRTLKYVDKLSSLNQTTVQCFHPHGYFPVSGKTHLKKSSKTMKTGKQGFVDVVSCYESEPHKISGEYFVERTLNIMGLGGGLEINLKNLDFKSLKIEKINVTVHDPNKENEVCQFLSKYFELPVENITVYKDCGSLIEGVSF